nr:PREDICTED: uncharacterized protein LOC108204201 [Daucus carota subsp. sativus]
MELKFFELKQENMSVAEYEKKFTELARFVGDFVDTEEKRARRFQQGLKPWLRSRVAAFEISTYTEKRKFNNVEGNGSQGSQATRTIQRTGSQPQNRTGSFGRKDVGNRNQGSRPQGTNTPRPSQTQIPECKICSKRHTGLCNRANVVCFKCQSKGHYANECKNIKSNVVCYKCGKTGHIARECKAPINNNLMQLSTIPGPFPSFPINTTPVIPVSMHQPIPTIAPMFQNPSYPAQARTFNMNMKDAVQSSDVVAGPSKRPGKEPVVEKQEEL